MNTNAYNKTKKLYESIPEKYDRHMNKTGHYTAQMHILEMLTEEIKEPILDLACGPGFVLSNLVNKFSSVFANDFSKSMIEMARKKIGDEITFYNFNAEDIILNKKFNTLICCNLFYYIKDRQDALKHWKKLLNSQGKLILIKEYPFITVKSDEIDPYREKLMSILDPLSIEQIIKILTSNGFVLKKQINTPIDEKHNLYGLIFVIK